VKFIELSDHPGEMLQAVCSSHQAAEERAQAYYQRALAQHEEQVRARQQEAQAQHQQALARHNAKVTELREERDQARAEHRWWAWLRASFLAWDTQKRRPLPIRPPVLRPPLPFAPRSQGTDEEAILKAGVAGEQMAAVDLALALNDDWTLLQGYCNRRGEIDHILLGPRGVFAIEIKHRNATVHIDGDHWRFDKYDRHGNVVGQGRITDGRGRSPSTQLNQPATELERFLHRRNHPVRLQRVIILNHSWSVIGSYRNLTIDLVATTVRDLTSFLSKFPPTLDPAEVTELQRLIVHDHNHHDQRTSR
jgi:Nuclease-related domain